MLKVVTLRRADSNAALRRNRNPGRFYDIGTVTERGEPWPMASMISNGLRSLSNWRSEAHSEASGQLVGRIDGYASRLIDETSHDRLSDTGSFGYGVMRLAAIDDGLSKLIRKGRGLGRLSAFGHQAARFRSRFAIP